MIQKNCARTRRRRFLNNCPQNPFYVFFSGIFSYSLKSAGMDFPAKWQVCRNNVSHKYTMESRYPPAKETSWTSIILGNLLPQILNLNISAILGRIPLRFTTFWGDQPAGKVALNCPDNCVFSRSFPLPIPWLQVNKNEKAFNFEAVLGEGFDETVSCPKGCFFLQWILTMNIIIRHPWEPTTFTIIKWLQAIFFWGGLKPLCFMATWGPIW